MLHVAKIHRGVGCMLKTAINDAVLLRVCLLKSNFLIECLIVMSKRLLFLNLSFHLSQPEMLL